MDSEQRTRKAWLTHARLEGEEGHAQTAVGDLSKRLVPNAFNKLWDMLLDCQPSRKRGSSGFPNCRVCILGTPLRGQEWSPRGPIPKPAFTEFGSAKEEEEEGLFKADAVN